MADRLNWGVRFVYREANNIAHKLAKLAHNIAHMMRSGCG